ncbi:MAG TPA: hypothetical protein VFP68_22680 [Burkholderiaceae bacterium]|nr:hypothetical protein [Burkholderiaceae bacterium]
MKADIYGDTARTLIREFEALELSSGSLPASAKQVDREQAAHMVKAAKASQRIVRQVWSEIHRTSLSAEVAKTSVGSGQDTGNARRQLTAIALLGVSYGATDDAELLHECLEAVLQDPGKYRMCRVITQGMTGQAGEVRKSIDALSETTVIDDRLKVAQGVALIMAGDPNGRWLIDNVIATSLDPEAREAAMRTVNYLDQVGRY